ncbi:hypothetical protein Glo7428_3030 [Gloeocapsa sp. PCC 7428]|nr:hypothetical protein Glo7428_3030 [Gloeocapsa sp. PCC 7428]
MSLILLNQYPVTTIECQQTSYTRPLSCQRVSQSSSNSKFITIQTAEPAQQSNETSMLAFTDEESDAAVRLFGCDCLVCINAVRQLRSLPPVS